MLPGIVANSIAAGGGGGLVVSVERVLITLSTIQTSNTGTLTKSQNAANCVPFTTVKPFWIDGASDIYDRSFVDVTISGSTVTVTRGNHISTSLSVAIYVVEFNSSLATVYSGSFAMTTSESSDVVSIGTTLSSTSDAFMVHNYKTANSTSTPSYQFVRGRISSTSQMTFDRSAASGAIDGTWYVVEALNGEFSVQHDTQVTSGTSSTDTITSVDTAKSFVIASALSATMPQGLKTIDLQNATTLRFRSGSSSAVSTATQVVTFDAAGSGNVQRGEINAVNDDFGTVSTVITSTDYDFSSAHNAMIFGGSLVNSTNFDYNALNYTQTYLTSATNLRHQRHYDAANTNSDTTIVYEVVEWPN